MGKFAPLSDSARKALKGLKEHGSLTLKELNEITGEKFNSSTLNALKNRGLVDTELKQVEVKVVRKDTVNVYTFAKDEPTE